jgi:glycosyltransferase involved in cell wall biosynthesis
MRNLKVAVVMPIAEQRGGAEMALQHLVQERLPEIEWLVIFLEDGPMAASFREMGVRTMVVAAGRLSEPHRYWSTVLALARLFRRERPDAVVSWMAKPHLYGGPAALMAGVPAMWFQHGIPSYRYGIDIIATLIPARGIFACSNAVRNRQATFLVRRPCAVVHPAADLARFEPERLPSPREARQRLGLANDGPLVGIVGRLQHWKGMHVLVEAMPDILKSYPNARCVVVGGEHALEAEYPAFLRRRVEELGLDGSVSLVGLQQNVAEWMQAMDVVVHASDNEPFGIVVVEAMALGKPVVASDTAGPTEVITNEINGLLTPYGDAMGLASAILRFLNDREYAAAVGAAARARAAEFSTAAYAQRFADALRAFL